MRRRSALILAGLILGGAAVGQPIELTDVGGSQPGLVLAGYELQSLTGNSISGAGDVNGDGLADLIVGAAYASPSGFLGQGECFVAFGRTNSGVVDLGAMGPNGFSIRGGFKEDTAGWSVHGAGDVNGDGLGDVVVSAPMDEPGVNGDVGMVYVVFGKNDGAPIELSNLGSSGFEIRGAEMDSLTGFSVSGAGDVNGDGRSDVIIGSRSFTGGGLSWMVFGKTSTTPVELSLMGTSGFVIRGALAGDLAGYSVSGAGDVNGDGLDDVIVSNPVGDPAGLHDAGRVYIVRGKTTTTAVELSALGTGGFVVNGSAADDYLGWKVSAAGDVNGDGLADVILGAKGADPNGQAEAGRSVVIFGRTGTGPVNLSALGAGGFFINGIDSGDESGSAVAGAGDVNGDGKSDLLIGAFAAAPNGVSAAGETYLVFGRSATTPINLSGLGIGGVILNGSQDAYFSGFSVGGAGDVNGDGLSDYVTGAPYATVDNNFYPAGAGYVLFGPVAPPSIATYRSYIDGGNTAAVGVGIVGDGSNSFTPDSRAWIGFTGGGTGPTERNASQQTVILTRNDSSISNLGPAAGILDAMWQISTNRTGWGGAKLKLRYLDSELGSLSENGLTLYQSTAGPAGPWSPVAATFDHVRNTAQATVASLGWFAIKADTTAPTCAITKISGDEEQDFVDYTISFSEPVAATFALNDLTIIGGDNGVVPYLGGTDPNHTLHLAFTNPDGTNDVSFSITGAVADASGNVLVVPLNSSIHIVNNYPDGDINHDGGFDLADVAMLGDINLGLTVFP